MHLSLLCENYFAVSFMRLSKKVEDLFCHVPFLLPYQLRLIGHVPAVVAVGVHEQLGVGVDGDKGPEVAVALYQVHHVFHLNLRVNHGAVVGIRAGVTTGTHAWRKTL